MRRKGGVVHLTGSGAWEESGVGGAARRVARRQFSERRRLLGFSQEKLAEHLEVERSTVTRWETGKSEPRPWLLPKLADALEVTSEELRGLLAVDASLSGNRPTPARGSFPTPRAGPVGSTGDTHEVPGFHLRRVLMGWIPDVPAATRQELSGAVASAWNLFFQARFDEMERLLPDALARAYVAAEAATGQARRQINVSVAQLLHASSNLLGYRTLEDLAVLALVRAESLAVESEDVLTLAGIKGSQSWLLARNGMYDDAVAHADRAATAIEPRLSAATPRQVSIWGELLCYAAFAASRMGDYRQARQYLRLCESADRQLEDDYAHRPEVSNMFSRTSAASFGVVNEIAAGRPREALKLAVGSADSARVPPTLRSRRLVNVAHAHFHNQDIAGTVQVLRQACAVAPELVGQLPLAHSLVRDLTAGRSSQRVDGLADVARQLNTYA
ncbi:MAG: helix-turn-helix transcriptional regulator [Nocardioides sp.]